MELFVVVEFVFPLMVLTAALASFRPRVLVAVALAGALAYNITPYLLPIPYRPGWTSRDCTVLAAGDRLREEALLTGVSGRGGA
jgi:hypothetical protein